MRKSEAITFTIVFQLSGFKTFKYLYIFDIQKPMAKDFSAPVSFHRLTNFVDQNLMAMRLLLKTSCLGESTGISFIYATSVRLCKSK